VKYLLCIAATLCAAAPLAAQERPVEPAPERTHVVRKGDTLWDLARTHLNDPFLWPEILRLNPEVVSAPTRLRPAVRLRIPSPEAGSAPRMTATEADAGSPGRFGNPEWGRSADAAAEHSVTVATPARAPAVAAGEFYRAGFLAQERDVTPLGRIAERHSPSLITASRPGRIQVNERVHLALVAAGSVRAGDSLHLVRRGRGARSLGRVFHPTGIARVTAVEGSVATVVIDRVYGMITEGDLVLPLPAFDAPGEAAPVAVAGPEGRLLAFEEAATLHMTQDVAFIDLGHASGIRAGDEFAVYRGRQARRWGVVPEVEIARLRVVRVDERTAAARVVSLQHPALEAGLVVRRVARMP
jgi:hypothetical protein